MVSAATLSTRAAAGSKPTSRRRRPRSPLRCSFLQHRRLHRQERGIGWRAAIYRPNDNIGQRRAARRLFVALHPIWRPSRLLSNRYPRVVGFSFAQFRDFPLPGCWNFGVHTPSAGAVASIIEEDDMGVKHLASRPFTAALVDSAAPGQQSQKFCGFRRGLPIGDYPCLLSLQSRSHGGAGGALPGALVGRAVLLDADPEVLGQLRRRWRRSSR